MDGGVLASLLVSTALMLGTALLSACAGMKTPEDIAGGYEPRTVAVAAVRGGGKQSAAITPAFAQRLGKSGVRAAPLEGLDDLMADSAFLETDASSGDKRFKTVGGVADADRAMAPLLKSGARRRDDGSSIEDSPGQEPPATLGLGVNDLGGQLAYQPTPRTRLELRYQIGKNGSGSDQVSASAVGLRGYLLSWTDGATHPYLGLEAAYLMGRDRSSHSVVGEAGGAFIGIERRLTRRLSIEVDAGPYFLYLRENEFHMTDASLQFVANTSLMFFIF